MKKTITTITGRIIENPPKYEMQNIRPPWVPRRLFFESDVRSVFIESDGRNYFEQELVAHELARVEFPRLEFRLKSWAWFKGLQVEGSR